MTLNIFDRARQMVAQSKSPTTLREELAKLSRRRRKPAKYGRVKLSTERFWWEDA